MVLGRVLPALLRVPGIRLYAPSLRGHGASSGRDRLRWIRLRDYVDDVADAVAHLPAQPILIGHSMGGFLVQKYLEEHAARGAVLVAPIPPTGAWRAALYILRQHPISFVKGNLSLSLAPLVATPELARDLFFSASMPDERGSRSTSSASRTSPTWLSLIWWPSI